MKIITAGIMSAAFLISPLAFGVTSYKHASAYSIGVLDQTVRVETGSDDTLSRTTTDAKLSPTGQNIHILHTEAGDYRVESPINKGMTIVAAMIAGANPAAYREAEILHNKWFLDNVQPGTKVLFASECAHPNKKHPKQPVRCSFWLPDPDSGDHEYRTLGDFTPYTAGNGSNTQNTARTLCGTGKMKADVEAELCDGTPAHR